MKSKRVKYNVSWYGPGLSRLGDVDFTAASTAGAMQTARRLAKQLRLIITPFELRAGHTGEIVYRGT